MKFIVFILFSLILSGCVTGHCHARNDLRPKTVFVYKADGTKQCGIGNPVSIQQMAHDLGEVKILSQENRSDGKLYPMVCGAPTGKINVYEIPATDLEKAMGAGFLEFKK